MSVSTMIFGVIFGSLGMGYIVYGRKQKKGLPLLAGFILCVLPFFISNIFFLLIAGIGAAVLPFVFPS
jgi:hypothetical protein